MVVSIDDIQNGFEAHSIHGAPIDSDETPLWQGRVLAEIALLAGDEQIQYAFTTWHGNQFEAAAQVLVITDSLVIETRVPDSRKGDHQTVAIARNSLERLDVDSTAPYGSPSGAGKVTLRLRLRDRNEILTIPLRGDATYASTPNLGPLATSLARDLTS